MVTEELKNVLKESIDDMIKPHAGEKFIRQYKQLILNILSTGDINICDKWGYNVLMYNVLYGREETVSILLKYWASPNIQNKKTGETPLHLATHRGVEDAISKVNILLKYGADIYIKDNANKTPEESAMSYGKLNIAAIFRRIKLKNDMSIINEAHDKISPEEALQNAREELKKSLKL